MGIDVIFAVSKLYPITAAATLCFSNRSINLVLAFAVYNNIGCD